MFDPIVFQDNQAKFTYDQLAPYDGRCVAWSMDGTRILASGSTWEDLHKETERTGLADFVTEYVDLQTCIGSAGFMRESLEETLREAS